MIVHKSEAAEYELEVPRARWETPLEMVENDRAKTLWNLPDTYRLTSS